MNVLLLPFLGTRLGFLLSHSFPKENSLLCLTDMHRALEFCSQGKYDPLHSQLIILSLRFEVLYNRVEAEVFGRGDFDFCAIHVNYVRTFCLHQYYFEKILVSVPSRPFCECVL